MLARHKRWEAPLLSIFSEWFPLSGKICLPEQRRMSSGITGGFKKKYNFLGFMVSRVLASIRNSEVRTSLKYSQYNNEVQKTPATVAFLASMSFHHLQPQAIVRDDWYCNTTRRASDFSFLAKTFDVTTVSLTLVCSSCLDLCNQHRNRLQVFCELRILHIVKYFFYPHLIYINL